jgi:hypothetical protein
VIGAVLFNFAVSGCQLIQPVENPSSVEQPEEMAGAELRLSDFEVIDFAPPEEPAMLLTTGSACDPNSKEDQSAMFQATESLVCAIQRLELQ